MFTDPALFVSFLAYFTFLMGLRFKEKYLLSRSITLGITGRLYSGDSQMLVLSYFSIAFVVVARIRFLCSNYGSGSGKIIEIRADPVTDPDLQHCKTVSLV